MSEIKVNSIKGVGASTAAITVNNTDGTCSANITSVNGGSIGTKNLIINGAMQVAQRGTSSTSSGYHTLDRMYVEFSGLDASNTHSQVDITSGVTPYTLGFRKALKITNGNQTSVGTSDLVVINYTLEAQDIANSGWNYNSASSFITFSFWVRSSVAQNFYGRLYSYDGTAQGYPFETGSLSANTWTKITKTIPGNSNLQFDNNNNAGLLIELSVFRGTDFTGTVTLDQWAAYSGSTRTPNNVSTWYSTDGATFEITALQLEVGSFATDFEHRSFGQELALCQRYCQISRVSVYENGNGSNHALSCNTPFFAELRASPTATLVNATHTTNVDTSTYIPSTVGVDARGFVVRVITLNTNATDYRALWKFDAEL